MMTEIIVYSLSFLGGVVSVVTIYKWIAPHKKIKWATVVKGIKKLKEDLIRDNFVPSLIVGIGRGCSIVGGLLSGCLGNVPIWVVDRVYEWKNNERKNYIRGDIIFGESVDKVLLVAGEMHTGSTAKLYSEHLRNIGVRDIRCLSFAKDVYPAFTPDYYYLETKKADVIMPWMITKEYKRESLKNARQH